MNRFFKDSVNLIRNYKWNSMFFRYFKVLIFVIIIPAIIFIAIILNYYLSSIKSDIATSQRYDIIKSVTQFDKAYDAIYDSAERITASGMTKDFIAAQTLGKDLYDEYFAFLNKEKRALPYINSVSVYNPKTRYVMSTYGSNYIDEFRDNSWFDMYRGGNADFSAPSYPKGIETPGMFNICCNLLINDRNAGLIIYTVDGALLTDQMYTGEVGKNEAVMIFNDEDLLLYSSDNRASYTVSEKEISGTLDETSYKKESVLKNSSYLYNFIASENHSFKLATALSTAAYTRNYSRIAYIMITYFVVTVLLVILFSLVVAFSFYRSIVNIVIKTSSISEDTGVNMSSENNELMYLSDTLLNTVKNHQQIESELVEKITKLKKVQSIALQTQINPHFLFNSLNLVNGFILEECRGESKAATMLSNISDILYIALNTKEYIVTVETEVEYVKKYLEIEQIKYPEKFVVKYDISPETLDCKTVKFVLQPIIENAIEHGIKCLGDKPGVIRVTSAVMNNRLVLSVSDNGPKISDEKLAELEKRLESEEIQETKHIGLSNVNQRIKLIFGEEYGVSIFSDTYETVVDIVMPVIE